MQFPRIARRWKSSTMITLTVVPQALLTTLEFHLRSVASSLGSLKKPRIEIWLLDHSLVRSRVWAFARPAHSLASYARSAALTRSLACSRTYSQACGKMWFLKSKNQTDLSHGASANCLVISSYQVLRFCDCNPYHLLRVEVPSTINLPGYLWWTSSPSSTYHHATSEADPTCFAKRDDPLLPKTDTMRLTATAYKIYWIFSGVSYIFWVFWWPLLILQDSLWGRCPTYITATL